MIEEQTRITYIYLYEDKDVKYIMNRSIPFQNVVGKKMLDALEMVGVNTYTKIMYELEKELQNFTCNVDVNTSHITILETHPEWENLNRSNQKDINERKRELAKLFGAVVRKTDIEITDADKQVSVFVMSSIRKIFDNIYKVLGTFVNSELRTTLEQEKSDLKADKYNVALKRNLLSKELEVLDNKHQEYVQLSHDVPILKEQYEKYSKLVSEVQPLKEQYDYYSNKVEDLKYKVEQLQREIAFLIQKEGKLKTNI